MRKIFPARALLTFCDTPSSGAESGWRQCSSFLVGLILSWIAQTRRFAILAGASCRSYRRSWVSSRHGEHQGQAGSSDSISVVTFDGHPDHRLDRDVQGTRTSSQDAQGDKTG